MSGALGHRVRRSVGGLVDGWNQVGVQTKFFGRTLRSIPDVFLNYPKELIRLIAQMGLGTGALAIIGGTVAIVGFLTVSTGALVAVQGYNQFAEIGVEALTGFASAFFNVRLIAPATTAVALSATIGAGATAQLGAMRINEEIDALEVIGIRSVAYLASTRVIAGVVVVIPLYCIGVLMSFWAAKLGTTTIYGQSVGVYDHYFNTFLNPIDLIWSFVQSIVMAVVIMLVHTYYGFTASGGPAGGVGGGRRSRGAHLAGHLGIRRGADLARRVRAIGQLQSGRLTHMDHFSRDKGLAPGWWTLILAAFVVASVWLSYALFTGDLKSSVPVTLTSDRSGLVMETNAKVKMRGVQVGKVTAISGGNTESSAPVSLRLDIDPDQIRYIPANVEARIRATTIFGAKFVDLVYPDQPSPQRLKSAGDQVAQRHHRGEHRLRQPGRRAGQDRYRQAQRGALGAGRRCPRAGRAHRSGHDRCQSGTPGDQPAQCGHPRGLAVTAASATRTAVRHRTSCPRSTPPAPPR